MKMSKKNIYAHCTIDVEIIKKMYEYKQWIWTCVINYNSQRAVINQIKNDFKSYITAIFKQKRVSLKIEIIIIIYVSTIYL